MRETMVIRFADVPEADADSSVRWALLDAGGKLTGEVRTGNLREAAAQLGGRRLLVVVPSTDLLISDVKLPTQQRKKAQRAVPYAMEEQLAEDVDGLHFALGAPRDGHFPVAVVAHTAMQHWLAALQAVDVQAEALIPDVLLLPRESDCDWTVLADSERCLVRTGADAGFVCDTDALETFLELAQEGAESTIRVQMVTCGDAQPPLAENDQVLLSSCEGGSDRILMAQAAEPPSIDLLQGGYSRTEQWGKMWRPWRAAAALLLIGIVLATTQRGLQNSALEAEQQALGAQIEQVYREAFPDARRVVNARAQMEQQLRTLAGGAGDAGGSFLTLLAEAGDVLRSEKGVQLQGASYRDGRLDVELEASDLQLLDRLKQQLNETGALQVEIQSATAGSNQRVQSRLRIEGKGS